MRMLRRKLRRQWIGLIKSITGSTVNILQNLRSTYKDILVFEGSGSQRPNAFPKESLKERAVQRQDVFWDPDLDRLRFPLYISQIEVPTNMLPSVSSG